MKDRLIIEIESSYPAAALRDLQESLINLMQRYDETMQTDRLDDVNCLEILKALLLSTEQNEQVTC